MACRQGIGFSPEIETLKMYPGCASYWGRQGIGFSPEIETDMLYRNRQTVDGRQGIGFSPEIETLIICSIPIAWRRVARGLASRLRLKQTCQGCVHLRYAGRQGIGFSPEIETSMACHARVGNSASPGDWLLA